MRTFPLEFYNVDNARDHGQVQKELKALLDPRPAALGLCECEGLKPGNGLPQLDDYRIIRDASKPGRENIVCYVKASLGVDDSSIKWIDCKETWTKTNPGAKGQHWPRSILSFRAGRLHILVAHAPPKGTDNVQKSQQEHCDKLVAQMAPWTRDDWKDKTDQQKKDAKAQARVVLWDANRTKNEDGPGPKQLGSKIDGNTAGDKIDCGTWRGGDVQGTANIAYFNKIAGVDLKSDHGHAFKFDLNLTDN